MADIEFILERMREYQRSPRKPTSELMAKRELAAQLRRLNNVVCSTTAPEQQIRAVAAALKEHADHLEAEDVAPDVLDPNVRVVDEGMLDFSDRSPIAGFANPISPPATFHMDVDARLIRGEVTFGRSMGGAPGRVHGGFVAALLDEALGRACMFAGTPGMTAEFTTRYLGPVPVETPLRIEARLDSVDGRQIRTSGEMYHGGARIVEVEGLFIGVDTEKFHALVDAWTQSDWPGVVNGYFLLPQIDVLASPLAQSIVSATGLVQSGLLYLTFLPPQRYKRWLHAGAAASSWAGLAAEKVGVRVKMYEGTKHTSATEALRGGRRMEEIQKALGHGGRRSTERYAKLAEVTPVDDIFRRRKGWAIGRGLVTRRESAQKT